MSRQLSKSELIELVNNICNPEIPDEMVSKYIGVLEENVPHPAPSDLIFWSDDDLTAEEVVDIALSYKAEDS